MTTNTATVTATTTATNESNTVKAAAALSAVLNAVDSYDVALGNVNQAYEDRLNALGALRAMGFKSVQSGKSLRYNKEAAPLKGEYSYTSAVSEFTARFVGLNPNATQKQIDGNNKQRVISLNFWLLNGKFTNNVGKDKAKLEHVAAVENANIAAIDSYQANQAAKISERQAIEQKKIITKIEADSVKIDAAIKNAAALPDDNAAKLVLIEKAKLLASNLAQAKADKKEADKAAAKDKKEADKAAKILDDKKQAEQDKKDAADKKAAAAIDVKKIASGLTDKLNTAQLKELITELQKAL